jgi:hypothetical protein
MAVSATTVTVTVDVSAEDRTRIAAIVAPVDGERVLGLILRAGAAEAVGYATGRWVFSTMADLRMFRVYCLIEAGMTLDESESLIAALFKMSPSGARRVVAATLARYSYELHDGVFGSIQERLDSAKWNDETRWEITLPPGFARERIFDLCKASNVANPERTRGAVWAFPHETYNWLRGQVGLLTVPKPHD